MNRKKKRSFLQQLEYKYGRFAIENISLYLILCYGFGYMMNFINSSFMNYLTLNPQMIMKGQVWRIFTWILVPPTQSNILFVLLTLYFYYVIGTSLERVWGTFRYNVYLLSGMLFTVVGAMLFYACTELGLMSKDILMSRMLLADSFYMVTGLVFTTYYINMSIFLAYAATYSKNYVLFMFVIPVQVKWMGIIYGAMLAYNFLVGDMLTKFVLGASLLNFVLFFLLGKKPTKISRTQAKHRKEFKREVAQSNSVTKHKCAVCGRTELDGDHMEFRFCSKCEGNYEYCQDHLFTHEHVKK